tara:strand:+ start:64 stop:279 length:216 start_codon:yes stop_codon:yes gene_type:complete
MPCDNIYLRTGALLITGGWIWTIGKTLNKDKDYNDLTKMDKIKILTTGTFLIGGLYFYTFKYCPLPHKLLK